jgi:hypothetical protein
MKPLLPAIALLALLNGCAYERVHIVSGRDYYEGRILSDWRLVTTASGRIRMGPGAQLAIRTQRQTQTLAQLEIEIVEGDGLAAYVRTTPHDGTSGAIALYYRTDGSSVRTESGDLLPLRLNAESTAQTLRFYNEGSLLWFAVGCDRVYEAESDRPATEYLVIESLPGSTIEISGIRFDESDVE